MIALLLQQGSTGDPTAIGIFHFFAGFVLILSFYLGLLGFTYWISKDGEGGLGRPPYSSARLPSVAFSARSSLRLSLLSTPPWASPGGFSARLSPERS
jgi:hypothetical protein